MTEPKTLAQLRHLYQNMVNGAVRDTASAKRIAEGLLAPAIEALERGIPPAVAGEPVAWLSTDCIGERYLCFTRPKDSDHARPLVFGDATPQPTQAQVGAVPLTADEVDDMAFGYCPSGQIGELRDLIHAVQERLGIKKENGHGLPT